MRRCLVVGMFAAVAVVAGAFALSCGKSAPSYSVTVAFDSDVQQPDLDAAAAALRWADSHAEMLIQETFPPIGHATVKTSASNFCVKLQGQLGAVSHVAQVTCEETSGSADGG